MEIISYRLITYFPSSEDLSHKVWNLRFANEYFCNPELANISLPR
jgi:hypothetical protein